MRAWIAACSTVGTEAVERSTISAQGLGLMSSVSAGKAVVRALRRKVARMGRYIAAAAAVLRRVVVRESD